MKNILEVAKGYVARGFSVIPLEPKGKRPALKSWKEFQERRPTNQELETWFGNSQHNIGIVTGRISGIAVIVKRQSNNREDNRQFLFSEPCSNGIRGTQRHLHQPP